MCELHAIIIITPADLHGLRIIPAYGSTVKAELYVFAKRFSTVLTIDVQSGSDAGRYLIRSWEIKANVTV